MLACIDAGHAMQIDIAGPAGSASLGKSVTVLPNGNIVVTDPAAMGTVGAAYLYSPSGTLISTLTGSIADDQVGCDGVVVLANGNYLIRSRNWDGAAANVGAVTWGSATTGVSGVVSASNSLVGSTLDDQVGGVPIVVLNNVNCVVSTPNWKNGNFTTAGAATWGDGDSGVIGVVSATNSLVGAQTSDQVASGFIVALSDGNYVVHSPLWNSRGAVTHGAGSSGVAGTVTALNSLIGSATSDNVGALMARPFAGGWYVVKSSNWDNAAITNAGAVTLAGKCVFSGTLSAGNSVLGTVANQGASLSFDFDPLRAQLVVGRPASNLVSLFAEVISCSSFE